jgi:predicted HTH transcriptional regulator
MWHLPIESLTFEDLDEFLDLKLPEGNRLDYKVEMPNDLAKIIAAFANTLGGLIVLGVEEDAKTTEPVWPPSSGAGKGMPNVRGLREKVNQIARDAIYPPVAVRTSPVILNKHLPGTALLVVRVDESKDAPHAVEKRREVYIYERVDNVSLPYRFAEIDRIAYLLDRRRKIEEDRENMLQQEIDQAHELLGNSYPLRWASVVPYFPTPA